MSPELIEPEKFDLKKGIPTKESDCYALGMVIYEVLSGWTPFSPSKAPAVMQKVLDGKRPGRPEGREGTLFTDGIWEVVELCWKPQPSDRISARDVLRGLGETPPPLDEDGDTGTDTNEQWDTSSNDSSASIFSFISSLEVTPNQSTGVTNSWHDRTMFHGR